VSHYCGLPPGDETHEGLWVFDDEAVGLRQEPFVSGAGGILDRLTAGIPEAAAGFTLLFSGQPFPGFQLECAWQREEFGGNWYHCSAYGLDGWLCPALFKYFETAPPRLYVRAHARGREEYGTRTFLRCQGKVLRAM
jgi:hypothetical protein